MYPNWVCEHCAKMGKVFTLTWALIKRIWHKSSFLGLILEISATDAAGFVVLHMYLTGYKFGSCSLWNYYGYWYENLKPNPKFQKHLYQKNFTKIQCHSCIHSIGRSIKAFLNIRFGTAMTYWEIHTCPTMLWSFFFIFRAQGITHIHSLAHNIFHSFGFSILH